MKNLLLFLSLSLATAAHGGSYMPCTYDVYLNTNGQECYADGTPAMEGECVAFVWQRTGVDFTGFTADGQFVGGNNDYMVVSGGITNIFLLGFFTNIVRDADWDVIRLSNTNTPFQVNNDGGWFSYGTFSAYLLDSRAKVEGASTVVCGFDPKRADEATALGFEGIPYRVNAWQPINDLTNLQFTASVPQKYFGYNPKDTEEERAYREWTEWGDPYDEELYDYVGTTAGTVSALPTNCPSARVKSFVVSASEAVLTVTNVASYLDYNVATSNDVQGLAARASFAKAELPKDGQSGSAATAGALTWRFPISGTNGFFKLIRQPLK